MPPQRSHPSPDVDFDEASSSNNGEIKFGLNWIKQHQLTESASLRNPFAETSDPVAPQKSLSVLSHVLSKFNRKIKSFNVDASQYKVTHDDNSRLYAANLYQCTAIAAVFNNTRVLFHFLNSNLNHSLQEMVGAENENQIDQSAVKRATTTRLSSGVPLNFLMDEIKSKRESGNLKRLEVALTFGAFSGLSDDKPEKFISQSIGADQPVKRLIELVGKDKVKYSTGTSIEITPGGKIRPIKL
ncbi:hypothetical protein FPJ27_15500 [Burkholderia sp. MS455]|uniref:hypothetical protein n=1 Tax=Burkholderia sp. MS455 TaxID=2811788 RepID=UPI00195CB34A|nr:hypothetical protein [Burkholderia sp. MS455]QRR07667.1 hypothetical protein FPJ27_15500 [Burkholderia sp. MS455]